MDVASGERPRAALMIHQSEPLIPDFIHRTYPILLERDPSSEEVALLTGVMNSKAEIVDLVSEMLKSKEYQSIRFKEGFSGAQSERKLIIRDLYRVVLGREPDDGGLNHYSGELTDLSRAAAIMESLLLSSEFHVREAKLGVRKTLERSFDVSQYLDLNADLRGTQIEVLEHFIRHGVEEGRSTILGAGHLDLDENDWLEGLKS